MVGVMVPVSPAKHVQPAGTLEPGTVLGGQLAATQEPVKKGKEDDGAIEPLKPALHTQPLGTLTPLLLAGHWTGAHVESKKSGATWDAVTLPV